MSPSAGSCEAKTEAEGVIRGHLGSSNSRAEPETVGEMGIWKELKSAAKQGCDGRDQQPPTADVGRFVGVVSPSGSYLHTGMCDI